MVNNRGRIVNESVNNPRHVTAIFAALADPTRRKILVHLAETGEGKVTELAAPYRMSLPAISRHLRVLERARLVERRRHGRVHMIHARLEAMKPAQEWIARFAAAWDFSFDQLERLLIEEKWREDRHKSHRR